MMSVSEILKLIDLLIVSAIYFALGVVLVSCGKETPPPIDPLTTFIVSGKHIEVKGTVKTVSVEQAKTAISMVIKNLEK